MSRQIVTEMGSTASTCKAPRTGREVREHGILGSVTRAIRDRPAAPGGASNPCGSGRGASRGRGRRRVVSRQGVGRPPPIHRRFLRGETSIEGLDGYRGERFDLAFQNEFSVGRRNRRVVVTVPDLICVLDSLSGEAIGTETLRYGQRVTVLAIPSPPVFLSEKGLVHAGPSAFGFDLPFVSPFSGV